MGNLIPLDGVIISGEAMVNQASLTGESLAINKKTYIKNFIHIYLFIK
ncbi:hypothetical protein IC171_02155 [Clostridioides sp. ES-S-0171-01]|nr:hypothetical protein [Clostridioides sp. ES-S-0171-01]UDN56366.1 hypothetical protein JJC02_03040 [Clostridioides sp. ES-S-0054-01]